MTDIKRMQAAAEWIRGTVFREEKIPQRPQPPVGTQPPAGTLPPLLRAARSLENSAFQSWQTRESVFLKQAKLLADYEDDLEYTKEVHYYYPTYQSLSNRELRGYFAWRTHLRKGDVRSAPLTFAYLYIYELLNQAGVRDALDGFEKLGAFRDTFGQMEPKICPYMDRWLVDYAACYDLDPALLAKLPAVSRSRSIAVLERIAGEPPEAVAEAARTLSPGWLGRSRFYADHQGEMDAVLVRVLRRMSAHYDTRCKKTMVEQYFGCVAERQVRLFEGAVFCDPLKIRQREYTVTAQFSYRCTRGRWTVRRRWEAASPNRLDGVFKTVDAVMRRLWGDRHPIKPAVDTKWIVRVIEEEAAAYLAETQAPAREKIDIDFTQLKRIRQDALYTQERLAIAEELAEEAAPAPPPPPPQAGETPLSAAEYRLLQCLLYGRDTGWVRAEGEMLSVLADGINEKLYDTFGDTVLDDTPAPVEDYREELEEMIHP